MPSGPKKRKAARKKKELEGESSPNVAENQPENASALEKEPSLKDEFVHETKSSDAEISGSEVVPQANESLIPVDDGTDVLDHSGTEVSERVPVVVQGLGIGQGASESHDQEVNIQENSGIDHDLPTNADGGAISKWDNGPDGDDLSRNDRIDQLKSTVIKGLEEAAYLSTILQEVLDDLHRLMDA